MLFSLLAASLLSLVTAQTFAPALVGCTTALPTSGALLVGGAFSGEGCADLCQRFVDPSVAQLYSYFQPSAITVPRCSCYSTAPSAGTYTGSLDQNTPEVCADDTSYSVFRVRTTFTFTGCFDQLNNYVGGEYAETADLNACFFQCRSYTGLLFRATATTYQCTCLSTETYQLPTTCGQSPSQSGFFAYSHPAPAAASMLTRRRKAADHTRRLNAAKMLAGSVSGGRDLVAQLVAEDAKAEYCPRGMTACNVHGSVEGYECIDTSSELESCGGCLYGEHGIRGTRTSGSVGVNCETLTDARYSFSSMTCVRGKCVGK